MPNTYLKTEARMALVLAELYRQAYFSNLVTRMDGNAFVGALGDTIFFKTKGITKARDYEWRTRTAPIVFDEIYRNKLPITIDKHMTQGVKFTDEEEKMDLESYRTEILVPQVEAIVERFDTKVQALLLSADWDITNLSLTDQDDPEGKAVLRQALAIKNRLDTQGTPAQGRKLVLGANAFAYVAASAAVVAYDPGQAKTVFQQGTFGKIAGMDVVDGSQQLGENDFFVVHPTWAVLPNVSPLVPKGVTWGSRATFQGWDMRVVRQYDINWAQEKSLVNTFWGLSEIKDKYLRHTQGTATAAGDGSEAGDIVILDGQPQFVGKNVRGARGTFVPAV